MRFATSTTRRKLLGFATFALLTVLADASFADRPTAPKLFPDKTLAYVRVDDTRELKAKLADTATGRMASDPQISPMLKEFYGAFSESVSNIQDAIGINLNEVLSIPNGELAIALLPGKERPTVALLLEAGDEMPSVEILIGKAEERFQSRGGQKQSKKYGEVELVRWNNPANPDRQFAYFIDAGVLVACSNSDYIESMYLIWTGNGIDHKPLTDNRKFTSILSRCVGTQGERPQVSFYVDPLAIAREVTKNNPGAGAVMAMLPALGVDGLQAIGGSAILAPKGFDSIIHAHLLIDSPRRGVLQVVRPKSGPTDPQSWVAEDINSYATANWDVKATLRAVKELYETFRGPDAYTQELMEPANKNLGIDLQKDFLDQLDDRFSIAQTSIRPIRVNSSSSVYAIKLKNGKTFASTTLPKLFETLKSRDNAWESGSHGSLTYYTRPFAQNNPSLRAPEPSFTVVGDEVLVSDSIEAIKSAIDTSRSSAGLLVDSLEFKIVREKMKSQLNDQATSMITYERPEEALRVFYDLAADKNNVQKLRDMSQNNPVFASLVKMLEKHQLPPFETFSKYMSPGGAFVTEEENGLHYTAFSLSRLGSK